MKQKCKITISIEVELDVVENEEMFDRGSDNSDKLDKIIETISDKIKYTVEESVISSYHGCYYKENLSRNSENYITSDIEIDTNITKY